MESVSCLHGRIRMLCPGPSTQQVLKRLLSKPLLRELHESTVFVFLLFWGLCHAACGILVP